MEGKPETYSRVVAGVREFRRQWLTGLIREVHVASRGTYGYRRVHAELTLGMGITVCERTVWLLMNRAGIYGLPGPTRVKRLRGVATADDLVNRKFHRLRPNELWVTDITQHKTREGWIYCAAVLDAFSRRIVGWSIDSKQDATLVVNALDMAIRNRRPEPGGVVHADHGAQGGFNRSSQHPVMEVLSGTSSASSRSGDPAEASLAWASEVPASCRGRFLGRDRQGLSAR